MQHRTNPATCGCRSCSRLLGPTERALGALDQWEKASAWRKLVCCQENSGRVIKKSVEAPTQNFGDLHYSRCTWALAFPYCSGPSRQTTNPAANPAPIYIQLLLSLATVCRIVIAASRGSGVTVIFARTVTFHVRFDSKAKRIGRCLQMSGVHVLCKELLHDRGG